MSEKSKMGPFVPKNRTMVMLTKKGQRLMYFIDHVTDGSVTCETMLLGQYLSDLIGSPNQALPMTKGCTDRVYFPQHSEIDFFEKPTGEEMDQFIEELNELAQDCSMFEVMVRKIVNDVEIQKNTPEEPYVEAQFDLPKAESLIKVTLNKYGANKFGYIKNAQAGHQELFYVKRLTQGKVVGSIRLQGQFLSEFEGCLEKALILTPETANEIYVPEDRRILKIEPVNADDIKKFRVRMTVMGLEQQQYAEKIDQILQTLPA